MTSQKQVRANQRNAAKSTGPKTDEGKAVVRLNALTHGMTAKDRLLPDESIEIFETFAKSIREHFDPMSDLEHLLIERVIFCMWRLRRVLVIEVGMLEEVRYDWVTKEDEGLGHSFLRTSERSDGFSKLARYEATIERGLYKALHELERIQATRKSLGEFAPIPVEVDIDGNAQ